MLSKFFAGIAGKFVAKKLKLEDGPMDSKKWWASKTLWAAIYIITTTAYKGVKEMIVPGLPDIPPIVDTIIASVCGVQVVRSRMAAQDQKPIKPLI
jgi:hypothetical protein